MKKWQTFVLLILLGVALGIIFLVPSTTSIDNTKIDEQTKEARQTFLENKHSSDIMLKKLGVK